jgi:hypothetical protein
VAGARRKERGGSVAARLLQLAPEWCAGLLVHPFHGVVPVAAGREPGTFYFGRRWRRVLWPDAELLAWLRGAGGPVVLLKTGEALRVASVSGPNVYGYYTVRVAG